MGSKKTSLENISLDHVELNSDKSFESHEELEWTAAEEATVRRKLDVHIVPLVTLLYLLCFIDR